MQSFLMNFVKLSRLKCIKSFCTSANNVVKPKNRLSEVRKFFQSKDSLRAIEPLIPDRFFRLKISPTDYNFVIDEEIAGNEFFFMIPNIQFFFKENIIKILEKYLDGTIIEANPGLGMLTKNLLKTRVEKVFVFDSMITQMPPLVEIMENNPEKLSCIPVDFFQIGRIVSRDKIDNGDRFETMFKDIPRKNWKEGLYHNIN